MKKHTYLISPQSREIEDFYRRLFFTDKEKHFSDKFTVYLAPIRLQTVYTANLMKIPKKQKYLISPTSREIEDF